jgi:hypothetical protein
MWNVGGDWHVVGIGDFNGDGFDDILWRNDDGTLTDWLGGANGEFNANWDNLNWSVGSDWTVASTGNFNGDSTGRDDILWRSADGTVTDWLGTATGGFNANWDNANWSVGGEWTVAATGDFNGDGRDDILWRSSTGQLTDWLGTATGGFAPNWDNLNQSVGTDWHIAGAGDFDADGRTDILWRSDAGQVTNWLGTATGSFNANWNNAIYNVSANWMIAGIGDFNGDSRADVLWRNVDGSITDWLGGSSGSLTENGQNAFRSDIPSGWNFAGIGDFNGDGRDDVLWRGSNGSLDRWFGSADGSLLTPAEQLWQQALANVSAFFGEIANQVDSYVSPSYDQASTYDMGDAGAPIGADFDFAFSRLISWTHDVQTYFDNHTASLLAFGHDPNFDLLGTDLSGFTANFGDNIGSITLTDSSADRYLINIGGNLLEGTWHAGDAPPQDQTSPDNIVITAHRDANNNAVATGYFVFDPNRDGIVDPSSDVSVLLAGYQTPNASVAANLFASQHVHNKGTTSLDEHAYELVHDAFAKFYDWTVDHLNALIYLGNTVTDTGTFARSVTAFQALMDLSRITYNIADSGGGSHGNATSPIYNAANTVWEAAVTTLNPDLWFSFPGNQQAGDVGLEFTIFHELGHALNGFELGPTAGADEMAANTAGRSMEIDLGLTLLSDTPGGYYEDPTTVP